MGHWCIQGKVHEATQAAQEARNSARRENQSVLVRQDAQHCESPCRPWNMCL